MERDGACPTRPTDRPTSRIDTVWFDLTLPVLLPDYTAGICRTVRRVYDSWAEHPQVRTRYCVVVPNVGFAEVAAGWMSGEIPDPRRTPPPAERPRPPREKSRFGFLPWQFRHTLRNLWEEPHVHVARRKEKANPFHPFPVGALTQAVTLGPTDLFLSLGGQWILPDLPRTVERAKRAHGFRYASLVYDLIPMVVPHLASPDNIPAFTACTEMQTRASDLILTISGYSKRDIERTWAARRQPLPPVGVCTLGSDLAAEQTPAAPDRGQPARPFVLSVGTIEARKGHWLMYHAWRKLLAELGPERTPDLVLAGKPGWMGDTILYLIKNDPAVRGKVIHACDPTDAELGWLYRHCLFTLYPSVYEGWGLPVEESFAHGKLCVTTTASSLPEVGGEFAEYVEPDDLDGLCAAVRRGMDPEYRAERERVIDERFRPNTWKQTAAQIQTLLATHFDLSAAEAEATRGAGTSRIPPHQWGDTPQTADVRAFRVRVPR